MRLIIAMRKYYPKIISQFDRKASTYDVSHTRQYSTMALHEMIRRRRVEELVQGYGNLLAIGCGTGWCLKKFSDHFSCFGIDISMNMLKQCKESNLRVCCAYGEKLPIKSNTCDYVLCINMFQYICDPLALLLEIKRVMKGKGTLILDFKNLISLRAMIHYIIRMVKKKPDTEKRYTIFGIRKLISDANSKICTIRGMEFHWFQTSESLKPKFVIKLLEIIERLLGVTPLKYFSGRLIISIH
ncbi:MAG: class I SAM-dependent methyltransferase [Candidatus Hodarchaeota archaeon]